MLSTPIAPTTRILIVTDARDDQALLDLLSAGIDGLRARGAVRGPAGAGPRILELGVPSASDPALTERQREVLAGLAQGRSNKEIARRLGVSPATVKTHVAQLLAVLGAANRTDAAMKARARGLL